jgi:outer membrane protein assembly factor BamB
VVGLASVVALSVSPAVARAEAWPTKGHDARRTGQSAVIGPASASKVETFTAEEGVSINITSTVGEDGVAYFGTWGITRSYSSDDRTQWEKMDGKVYAVRGEDVSSPWAGPFHPDPVPYCYDYGDRADPSYCPDGGAVSWYNGTVEGTGVLSPDGETLYVGRGDGRVYALDTATGDRRWTFKTYNPVDPDDPDGGGEVIGGPLLTPDGTLYFATAAAGPWETNAIYAVDAATGTQRWRHPAAEPSLPQLFWAAPVLSPDGRTVYVAGSWGPAVDERDPSIPGTIYAFDLGSSPASGEAPLKWTFDPTRESELGTVNVFSFLAAAGTDGTLYVGGSEYTDAWGTAVVFALEDHGDRAAMAWPDYVDVDRGDAAMVYGLALREEGGATTRVYATSANGYGITGYSNGGELLAIDPDTGAVQWSFDPLDHALYGALSGVAIDAAGTVYTGVSGLGSGGGTAFAVSEAGELKWRYTLGGLLEWGAPVLGPSGDLFVSDTRRCLWAFQPIEDGLCDGTNIDPKLYVIRPGEAGGCGSRSGDGCAGSIMPALLVVAGREVRRRRRR